MNLKTISVALVPALFLMGLNGLIAFAQPSQAEETSRPLPNIVYILADDMGAMDPGYTGNKFYETPNIDRLAAEGMVFTRSYSGGPNCLPTRACLMTGMYGPRTHCWQPAGKSKGKFPFMKLLVPNRANNRGGDVFESRTALEPEMTSLAELLKTRGYASARFGKWHLGKDTQGFDISHTAGFESYSGEGKGYRDPENSIKITNAAVKFIEDQRESPFFLYLSHFEVHTPLKAAPAVVEKYQNKLASRYWSQGFQPTYAAMIEAVDNSVGRVLAKLDELKLSDDTLVVFASDNGGVGSVTPLKPLKAAKGSLYEGGIRVPTCMKWSGRIEAGTTCDTPITSVDWMPTLAELSGAQLPGDQPVDGVSVVPLLSGKKLEDRSIFWHYPLYLAGEVTQDRVVPVAGTKQGYWRGVPSSAICQNQWKLIHFLEDDHFELYDVASDPAEANDLAQSHAGQAKSLLAELNRWREETGAPMPSTLNPSFDASFEVGTKSKGKRKPKAKPKQNAGNNAGLASEEELFESEPTPFANPKDDPNLPNVLLIGDSISIAYTTYVRNTLAKQADVFRIPSNGKDSSFGAKNLDKWLKLQSKWDVIHFNWGLWDICYRHPKSKVQGFRDKVNGTLTTTPEDYRGNLEKIVARLKKTGARLIWCATTPVPEKEAGRKMGDEIKYNQIAAEIMQANDIPVDDLHSHALKRLPGIATKPGDVHFTSAGSRYLGEQVIREITQRFGQ